MLESLVRTQCITAYPQMARAEHAAERLFAPPVDESQSVFHILGTISRREVCSRLFRPLNYIKRLIRLVLVRINRPYP